MHHHVRTVAPWLAVGLLVGIIVVAAQTPGLTFVAGGENDLIVRKSGHAGAYAVLAVLVQIGLRLARDGERSRWDSSVAAASRRVAVAARTWIVPLGFAIAVAAIDELLQATSPGREGKVADFMIDVTGAITGLVLVRSSRVRGVGLRIETARAAGIRDTLGRRGPSGR